MLYWNGTTLLPPKNRRNNSRTHSPASARQSLHPSAAVVRAHPQLIDLLRPRWSEEEDMSDPIPEEPTVRTPFSLSCLYRCLRAARQRSLPLQRIFGTCAEPYMTA